MSRGLFGLFDLADGDAALVTTGLIVKLNGLSLTDRLALVTSGFVVRFGLPLAVGLDFALVSA